MNYRHVILRLICVLLTCLSAMALILTLSSCRRKNNGPAVISAPIQSPSVREIGFGQGHPAETEKVVPGETPEPLVMIYEEGGIPDLGSMQPVFETDNTFPPESETATVPPAETSPYPEFKETNKPVVNADKPSWRESETDGKVIREEYVIPEGVWPDEGGIRDVDAGENNTVTLTTVENQVEGLRVDYRPAEKIISDEVAKYLVSQRVSNAYSHISDPQEIPGTNLILEGLPFFVLPGFSVGKISRTEADYEDVDGDGILAAVYEKCDEKKAAIWGLDKEQRDRDCLSAVYVDAGHVISDHIKDFSQSLLRDFFYMREEIHLGIRVRRPAEHPEAGSDYFFLAYPLLDGKYVISIGGGTVLLNSVPRKSVDIYFYNGGGDLGFYDLEIAVDGKVVFCCDRFKINSCSVDTVMY